jgi:membrane fusion protein (multidrug efflux system)
MEMMNHTDAPSDKRPRTGWFRRLMFVVSWFLPIVGVIGLLAGIAYLKYGQIQTAMAAPPPPEMPVIVDIAAAEPITFRRSSVVIGTVLAPQSIQLRNEFTGVVSEVLFRPGQMVRRGDVLVQFDVRIEQADLKSAMALRKRAESSLRRAQQLSRSSAMSDQELDTATADLAQAEAGVERLQAMIDKKTLRAPFDARAGLFDLHVGQYLDAGSEITTLEGVDDFLFVDMSLPAQVADAVKIGDQVQVRLSNPEAGASAEIIAMDSQADPISRSVTARAKLATPPATLQPNDSLRVVVEYGERIAANAVPSTAIRRGPTGNSVFVAAKKEDGLRAESREVVVAGSDGKMTWIVDGVTEGERIVTDGSFKVSEGALLAKVQDEVPVE